MKVKLDPGAYLPERANDTDALQDIFLTQAQREHCEVTFFLMNGFQMRGVITGADASVVVLTQYGKQHIVYKHAISTIVPEYPLPLYDSPDGERVNNGFGSTGR